MRPRPVQQALNEQAGEPTAPLPAQLKAKGKTPRTVSFGPREPSTSGTPAPSVPDVQDEEDLTASSERPSLPVQAQDEVPAMAPSKLLAPPLGRGHQTPTSRSRRPSIAETLSSRPHIFSGNESMNASRLDLSAEAQEQVPSMASSMILDGPSGRWPPPRHHSRHPSAAGTVFSDRSWLNPATNASDLDLSDEARRQVPSMESSMFLSPTPARVLQARHHARRPSMAQTVSDLSSGRISQQLLMNMQQSFMSQRSQRSSAARSRASDPSLARIEAPSFQPGFPPELEKLVRKVLHVLGARFPANFTKLGFRLHDDPKCTAYTESYPDSETSYVYLNPHAAPLGKRLEDLTPDQQDGYQAVNIVHEVILHALQDMRRYRDNADLPPDKKQGTSDEWEDHIRVFDRIEDLDPDENFYVDAIRDVYYDLRQGSDVGSSIDSMESFQPSEFSHWFMTYAVADIALIVKKIDDPRAKANAQHFLDKLYETYDVDALSVPSDAPTDDVSDLQSAAEGMSGASSEFGDPRLQRPSHVTWAANLEESEPYRSEADDASDISARQARPD